MKIRFLKLHPHFQRANELILKNAEWDGSSVQFVNNIKDDQGS